MFKVTLLCVTSLAVGAGFGWQLRGDGEPTATRPMTATAATPTSVSRPVYVEPASSLDIEQVRAMLREELAKNASGHTTPVVVQQPATPELVARRRVATEEIETMIRGGAWGNEQRAAFHQRIGMLDPEQGARVLREVTMAINNGTLQMSTNGPPL